MELLLNLVWLLLAVPAYWLWRRSGNSRARHNFSALRALLALGCMLVLLFPVISATDDLHVLRAEIEESPASKRSIRHASSDKASVGNFRLHAPPAVVVENLRLVALLFGQGVLPVSASSVLPRAPLAIRAVRAPPRASLA